MLNEACSSGCGSFIQTFAGAMGYDIAEFARLGLFAKSACGTGFKMYSVHELICKAGAKGRSFR